MNKELQDIEKLALRYGDPIRGKLLAMISTIEAQAKELLTYKMLCKGHLNANEQLRNQLREAIERVKSMRMKLVTTSNALYRMDMDEEPIPRALWSNTLNSISNDVKSFLSLIQGKENPK